VKATFAHTNVIARDWRRLADFYQRVFGCVPLPPERDLSGPWLDAATTIEGAHIRGIHLRLPGHGADGPTLEIFQYAPEASRGTTAINAPGFAHIAFRVDDVAAARDDVIAAGGKRFGELVSVAVAGAGSVTFVYVADPEGNVIELQSWSN
jgi:catechol 2,3-dioxygenase-like lactoylglutathione lyase family enzyme